MVSDPEARSSARPAVPPLVGVAFAAIGPAIAWTLAYLVGGWTWDHGNLWEPDSVSIWFGLAIVLIVPIVAKRRGIAFASIMVVSLVGLVMAFEGPEPGPDPCPEGSCDGFPPFGTTAFVVSIWQAIIGSAILAARSYAEGLKSVLRGRARAPR